MLFSLEVNLESILKIFPLGGVHLGPKAKDCQIFDKKASDPIFKWYIWTDPEPMSIIKTD
ncbi:9705_t:CDS:2 [Rhizophagus irregularis]|nr:9705_t:CDS:2 [Rhizophagus irregularis]